MYTSYIFLSAVLLEKAKQMDINCGQVLLLMDIVKVPVSLGAIGGIAAKADSAKFMISFWRVTFSGTLAMGLTALEGHLFGAVVYPNLHSKNDATLQRRAPFLV